MHILTFMIMVACILVPSLKISIANSSIKVSQVLRDQQTLVSNGGKFELGFFSPGNSQKRYLGLWYRNIPVQKVLWVANRANPINDSSGILTLNPTGNLVLTQKNGSVVWHTNTLKQAQNPLAVLLDNGNLLIRNEGETKTEEYLWQSFDHPSDTLFPGMKYGWDLRTSLEWSYTAWKSPDDPSPGEVSRVLKLYNYPEFYTMKGTQKWFRFGPWNGLYFSGSPDLQNNTVFGFNFVSNKEEIYYTYSLANDSVLSISVINETGTVSGYVWLEGGQNWRACRYLPSEICDNYGLCGPYGNCVTTQSQVCQCLRGFNPKSPQKWYSSDWSGGCVRNKPLSCNGTDKGGFVKFEGLKVPDTTHTWLDESIDLKECRVKCLNNCSCMAYTNSDIRNGGSGCVMWFGDLIDMRQFQTGKQDLYIRMATSEIGSVYSHNKIKTLPIVVTIVAVVCGVLLCSYLFCRIRRNKSVLTDALIINSTSSTALLDNLETKMIININITKSFLRFVEKSLLEEHHEKQVDDLDVQLFDLFTIATATNDFSAENKIGEGGFGPVYKGVLTDMQDIAVKTLSRSSWQGVTEFINEVKLIAKLQHRNLVKLLGCCIQGQEKMLVYEYMANGSLDSFIFDDTKSNLLEWPQRFHIICGIARGLMYLHQDSRLRIIHRDLKASNVLLDKNLSPKISDFGLARIFGGDQIEGNTRRVVGTYGYMAPEYAVDGLFSVKSDVFSFGILLLEIVCGKKNRGFYNADESLNLVGHAWTLWKKGRALELVDSNKMESCIIAEVLRCLHVSLLCVQQYPEDRPTMASVILMLETQMELVEPKEHGFISRNVLAEEDLRLNSKDTSSSNHVTISMLEAR